MTFVGKKFDRYILPAFLALDLVAALGWISLGQIAVAWLQKRSSGFSGNPGHTLCCLLCYSQQLCHCTDCWLCSTILTT